MSEIKKVEAAGEGVFRVLFGSKEWSHTRETTMVREVESLLSYFDNELRDTSSGLFALEQMLTAVSKQDTVLVEETMRGIAGICRGLLDRLECFYGISAYQILKQMVNIDPDGHNAHRSEIIKLYDSVDVIAQSHILVKVGEIVELYRPKPVDTEAQHLKASLLQEFESVDNGMKRKIVSNMRRFLVEQEAAIDRGASEAALCQNITECVVENVESQPISV